MIATTRHAAARGKEYAMEREWYTWKDMAEFERIWTPTGGFPRVEKSWDESAQMWVVVARESEAAATDIVRSRGEFGADLAFDNRVAEFAARAR